jgi:hypothetical protein
MSFHPAGSCRETFEALFDHPVRLDLDRGDVQTVLCTLAEVSYDPDGRVTFTRNGQTLVLRDGPRRQAHTANELMTIRHFLQRAAARSAGAVACGADLMVVIDDEKARVFELRLRERVPCSLAPYDPHRFAGHLRYAGGGKPGEPECKTFYEAVAKTLRGAERIVLAFGNAVGARGAVNTLLAELRLRHRDLAERVFGTFSVDEQNPSEARLLDTARDFYSRHQFRRESPGPSRREDG